MRNNPIQILSTRPLAPQLLQEAASENVWIDCVSFIETSVNISPQVKDRIKQLAAEKTAVVFTSMNAAEAVIASLDGTKPEWDIYCMGGTTKTIVKEHFGDDSIKGTGKDAVSLAQTLIDNPAKEAVFFCGNIRRDELPQLLSTHQVDLEEIVVYATEATPILIDKKYDGILFYSPSAVESFFSINTVDTSTILFAIGNTTAKTIANYSGNTVVVSDSPDKDSLARKAVGHFAPIHTPIP
ncbi:uroporphyrinogen-III synthase [Parasediminibacterium sp. JCM 36343]|uniref:uroporphyrinogen-III synthase n=1 Tax=Parasediminibacterium sp. JCM 36343 TaxID=3374279 RepID=UPI00397B6516